MQKTLKCVRECTIPGVGFWQVGDLVTDAEILAKIGDAHPCFELADDAPIEPTEETPQEEGT